MVAFVVLFVGIYMIFSGASAIIKMQYGDFELVTTSIGFALVVADLVYVAYVTRLGAKKGRGGWALYDIPSPSQASRRTVRCQSCGAEMSISQPICQNCGTKRPLY